ncbi:hypothetical protein ACIRPH_16610 [Nocardiopsis sp. NPDC101807]|uniref:hypothetical protein n=1 Tax=Nocardiopsis sp. NPDC101807 TaxID=3364339 RepID=UPI0038202B5D
MAEFVSAAGAWPGSWARDEAVPGSRAAAHGAHPLPPAVLAEGRGARAGRRVRVRGVVGGRPDPRGAAPVGAAPGA